PTCRGNITPSAGALRPTSGVSFTFFAEGLSNPAGPPREEDYAFSDDNQALVPGGLVRVRSTPGLEHGDLSVIAPSGLTCFDNVYGVALAGPSADAPPLFDDVTA